jgi:hypothetical protein
LPQQLAREVYLGKLVKKMLAGADARLHNPDVPGRADRCLQIPPAGIPYMGDQPPQTQYQLAHLTEQRD